MTSVAVGVGHGAVGALELREVTRLLDLVIAHAHEHRLEEVEVVGRGGEGRRYARRVPFEPKRIETK